MTPNSFVKSHGLGNDYIVLDSENLQFELTKERIIRICDVHFGIGSDGILVKVPSKAADFGLVIYNTDASIAENCGNGLRIFSKFLHDYGYTQNTSFTVDILGRIVRCNILEFENGKVCKVQVEMGKATFTSSEIPINFHKNEFIGELLDIENQKFTATCVSIGNPHCVVIRDSLDVDELCAFAPKIQALPTFPQ
jgi:diaminopimelate epimerase